MVNYTPRKSIPYPSTADAPNVASRDFRDMAWSVDSAIVSTEAYLNGRVDTTQNQIASTASQLKAALTVQGEEFEQLLNGVSTAYDVAVANGYDGSISQWLDSLRGPRGPEGPYGGASVTDPQVASYVGADTATRAALENGFIVRRGKRGTTRRIYVRSTGDDTNDGSSEQAAFREIRTAVASLSADGPVLRGSVLIDVGPGTYEGGIRVPVTRGMAQDDFIKIVGKKDSFGMPTTFVRHTAGNGTGYLAEDGAAVWLEDIKFVGGFGAAVQLTRNVYAWFVNVYGDGEGVGVRGFSISSHTRYYVKGGLLENYTYAGIDEYFNVARSYATVSSAADQMLIRNCRIGLRAKEGCVGHLDYLQVEGNETGIDLIQNSVANLKGVSIRRNKVGLALANSTSHNEGGVIWGTGADANDREVYSVGASGELRSMMWSGEDMATDSSRGHRPLFVIANNFSGNTITGASGIELQVAHLAGVLPRPFFRTVGKRIRLRAFGRTTGASVSNPVTLVVRVGTVVFASTSITSDSQTLFELDAVCVEEKTTHRVRATTSNDTGVKHTMSNTKVLEGDPNVVSNVTVFARFSAAGQSWRNDSVEMWG